MQTLYPPLHDDKKDEAPNDGDDDVLSEELKDSFDAMRAMLRSQSRSERTDDEEDRKRKARELATKTALAAEEEMARLRNGIAELEALLAQQEHQQQQQEGDDDVGVVFPVLPPAVVEQDEGTKKRGELVSDSS